MFALALYHNKANVMEGDCVVKLKKPVDKKVNTDISTYLWDRFVSGDDNAYSQLYKMYANEMFAYGTYFLSDRETIKDCIQNVFIRVYDNREKIGSVSDVKLYLFMSLKNSLYNVLKYKSNHLRENIEEIPLEMVRSAEDVLIETEDLLEQKQKIKQILMTLSPRQKEVIYYRYVEELSYDEICERLGMNYQSVRNLLHRSIRKVRDNFPEYSSLLIVYAFRTLLN